MASQQLKLLTRERSRRVGLVLGKDRNHAIFVFGRGIGMNQALDESEYSDVTPNSKRNRQQQNARKPGRSSESPRRLAYCQQTVGECHRFDSQKEFTATDSVPEQHLAQRFFSCCSLNANRDGVLNTSFSKPCWMRASPAVFKFERRRPKPNLPFGESNTILGFGVVYAPTGSRWLIDLTKRVFRTRSG
jgi:hypothetical protein